jgi:hypothetical protein
LIVNKKCRKSIIFRHFRTVFLAMPNVIAMS